MARKLMVVCAMALGALAVVAATTYTVSNTGEGIGTPGTLLWVLLFHEKISLAQAFFLTLIVVGAVGAKLCTHE